MHVTVYLLVHLRVAEPAAAGPAQPTAALSHNVIRPNLLTLRPTYSYEMITIDNKLFSPTIKTRYEV